MAGGEHHQMGAAMTDQELIRQRLAERAADLAEVTAVHAFWLDEARKAGIAAPEGSTWNNAIRQFVPDDHEVVADGMGGFRIQPQSATASSGSQVRP